MCFPPPSRFLLRNSSEEVPGPSEVWCPVRDELMFQLPLGQVSHLYLPEDFLETRNNIFVKLGGGVGLGTGLIKDPCPGCS